MYGNAQDCCEKDPLQEGYVAEGKASASTGVHAWDNPNNGSSYGGGVRFDHEETPYMTKVKGRNGK